MKKIKFSAYSVSQTVPSIVEGEWVVKKVKKKPLHQKLKKKPMKGPRKG